MTILEKIKFEEDWLSEVDLTKENVKIAFGGIRATALESQRWIPISERLPNFNDIVLASTDSDYDELRVILITYSGEEFWFNGKIKAWMPLPESYRGDKDENINNKK